MGRTVRLASLLRWLIVAMHTALVVSTGMRLATAGRFIGFFRIAMENPILFLVLDLPVTFLAKYPVDILEASISNRAIRMSFVFAIYVVLGGLQWYLIASLVARLTCGFQKAIPVASMRFRLVLVFALLITGVCVVLPWSSRLVRELRLRGYGADTPPAQAFSGDSRALRQSVVVPTLDTPMPEGKNVIWCATFQLAWNELKRDVIGGPILVSNAEDIAQRLNQASVTDGDLPPGSYYAAAGFVKDGIVEEVRREMRQRFGKEPIDLGGKSDVVILAYAYLRASVPFTLPYFENQEVFLFTDSRGRKTPVSSFGLRPEDRSAYFDLRKQVGVLHCQQGDHTRQPAAFALDLCRDSKPNQVIVARLPKRETLLETVKDLERRINTDAHRDLDLTSLLLVPNLNWSLNHHFAQLEGPDKRLLNSGFESLFIETAMQTVDFRLDRNGVEIESEAGIMIRGLGIDFCCDRPFLILVKKRGADRPFFVMWVENAELLCKSPEVETKE